MDDLVHAHRVACNPRGASDRLIGKAGEPNGDVRAMSFEQAFENWMSDGTIAWCGLALTVLAGALYVTAAGRRSPRGLRWPLGRTAAFLAGLLVIVLALDSGVAAHDEVPAVHMFQHALLMMLAPMLLALGTPITLTLRRLPRRRRARLLALLHHPSVRGVVCRPVGHVASYNLAMAIVLIAPVYRLAEEYVAIHVALHFYLIVCGLLFWTAILARDPIPGRISNDRRIAGALMSIPLSVFLATAVVVEPAWFTNGSRHAANAVAAILLIATITTSAAGSGIVAWKRRRHRRAPRGPVAGAEGLSWSNQQRDHSNRGGPGHATPDVVSPTSRIPAVAGNSGST